MFSKVVSLLEIQQFMFLAVVGFMFSLVFVSSAVSLKLRFTFISFGVG